MSKAILLSIKPEYVAKILNGEKTIEIRKHAIPVGTKVYIYCCKNKKEVLCWKYNYEYDSCGRRLNGKVVASFVVDSCYPITYNIKKNVCFIDGVADSEWKYLQKNSCVSKENIMRYSLNSKDLFAWHISQLKIFDRPKKLGMFYKLKPRDNISSEIIHLTKAPQSYCYVEELKDE